LIYLILKLNHLLFFTLFLGVGIGTVFYKLMADRSGKVQVIATTMRHVVLADFIFTMPAAIGLPLTGVAMLHGDLSAPWVTTAFTLYVLAGIPWLCAVKLQLDMRRLACMAAEQGTDLSDDYWRKTKIWGLLGIPSGVATLLLVYLMVFKQLPWG
jgi:uncharacterized membrane protein